MDHFFETIRIEEGLPIHLSDHLRRMERTAEAHHFSLPPMPDLVDLCPPNLRTGLVRCRVDYRATILQVAFTPYQIRTLGHVVLAPLPPGCDYRFKSNDRSLFETLKATYHADELILVTSEGLLTDSTFSNLVLESPEGLFTPSTPLLAGTRRARLLARGIVKERVIGLEDLRQYRHLHFINAMLGLGKLCIEVAAIDLPTQDHP